MIQTKILDQSFLKEISFEVNQNHFKLKAGSLFGQSFGDNEYIPQNFKVSINNKDVMVHKISMDNTNGQITISYVDESTMISFLVYL